MAAILTYHALEDSRSVTAVSPDRFRMQMAALARNRYEILDLAELARRLDRERPLPRNVIALTFDDGYRSVHTVALPELRRRGFPATVFLATGHCGRWNDWPGEGECAPRRPMLTIEEVRALHDAGVAIGAHSVTHRSLSMLPFEAARREIEDSQRWLEDRLATRVGRFAYPYGATNRRLREYVASRFELACTTELRLARSGDDRHALPRIDAFYLDGILRLGGLHTHTASVYLRLRHALRRLRSSRPRRPRRNPQ